MPTSRWLTPRRFASLHLAALALAGLGLFLYPIPLLAAVALLVALAVGPIAYSFVFLSDLFLRMFGILFFGLFYRVRVFGRSRIPAEGGVLLVCNHVSFIDWLILVTCVPRPVRFVIDHMFYRGWLVRWVLSLVRVIPIATPREDRGKLANAYDRIAEELNRGEVVCIFPEGVITYDGQLSPFKPGVMKVLRKTPVPVVPMALTGLWGSVFSRKDGPALRKLPRGFRRKIELRVGDPLPAGEVTLAKLAERVSALLGV